VSYSSAWHSPGAGGVSRPTATKEGRSSPGTIAGVPPPVWIRLIAAQGPTKRYRRVVTRYDMNKTLGYSDGAGGTLRDPLAQMFIDLFSPGR
jgi:hypothetical protein